MTSGAKETVQILDGLRRQLQMLSDELQDSQLFVDFADIHEVCRQYLESINELLSSDPSDMENMENILHDMRSELFDHLEHHLKSLKRLLPKAIHELEQKQSG